MPAPASIRHTRTEPPKRGTHRDPLAEEFDALIAQVG
jgi:hypothetical protein